MRIETERLILRRIERDDLGELVAIHSEKAVSEFMGSLDRDRLSRWMAQNEADWAEHGYGRLAMVERATGRLLGRTGLKHWPQFDESELGWVVRPDAWGRGFATEAGRACADWGFRNLAVPYLTAMIRPDNARSIAVAERLGMSPLREDFLMDEPVIVYVLRRSSGPGPQRHDRVG